MKKSHIIIIALALLMALAVVTQAFALPYIKHLWTAQDLGVPINEALKPEEHIGSVVESEYNELQSYLDLDKEDMAALYNVEGLSSDKHDLLQENLEDEFAALANSDLTEEEKLIRIVEILFKLKEMNKVDERRYDFDFLIADKQNLMPGLQFFLDFTELGRNADSPFSEKYTYVVRPFVTEVQILGDSAKVFAKVEELFLYEVGWPGSSQINYEIDFVKINNNWFIAEIRSSVEIESNYVDNNIRLDVEAIRQEWLNEKLEAEQRLLEMNLTPQELREMEEAKQQELLELKAAIQKLREETEAFRQQELAE